jgi:hypothetical protein
LRSLQSLQSEPISLKPGTELVRKVQIGNTAYDRPAGLHGVLLGTSNHSLETLTDTIVCSVDAPRLLNVFHEFPRLGAAISWSASRNEAMIVDRLVSIGRRSAIERIAHLFLELGERLRLVGLVDCKCIHVSPQPNMT